jgi:hypothetical protein
VFGSVDIVNHLIELVTDGILPTFGVAIDVSFCRLEQHMGHSSKPIFLGSNIAKSALVGAFGVARGAK